MYNVKKGIKQAFLRWPVILSPKFHKFDKYIITYNLIFFNKKTKKRFEKSLKK